MRATAARDLRQRIVLGHAPRRRLRIWASEWIQSTKRAPRRISSTSSWATARSACAVNGSIIWAEKHATPAR